LTLQNLLSKQVNIETYSATQVFGARVRQWTPLYIGLPARVQPLSATAIQRFDRDSMGITHKVYIGSPGMGLVNAIAQNIAANITQKERLVLAPGTAGQRYFEIVGVRDVDEIHRYLVLDCKEVKA
jgi:hypothetical protein